ncbi:hypothetical protein GCM10023185_24940 [Hymenobacter saemangeumensis]|uniref:T9SS type A sorting domain-containing protein n=1 Tax=Hymenobacter saemangeumensis TaxID=1084522 RepID=A0ABP8IHA3_9BACT
MNTPLHLSPGSRPGCRWLIGPCLLALLLLLCTGSLTWAQTTGPDGGTLSPASTTVCSGFNSGTLTLSGFTGTIVKYQFDNGNGFTDIAGSGGSATYTFSNLTLTTRYRAVVQNGANPQVASTVATVTVNQPPTATINSQGPTRFCQQGTIFLVAGPSGNYTYQFLRNGVPIAGATSQTYTATVTTSAGYSVRVTDAAGCSATSSTIQIDVQPQNVVTLGASGSTTVCQGSSVLLTASTSGIGANNYTYQFERDGVQIPGATSSTYAATISGSYRVVVFNPSTCTSTSNAVTVTVVPVPTVTLSYSSPSYCQSGSPNPTPTYSPTGGSFSATPAGLSLNPSTGAITLASSNPGTYTVTYNSGGTCPGTASTSVTIIRAPQATFSYPAGNYCAGTTGSISAVLASGSTAGTFTATPAGLSLNASTGAVNLSGSTAGTYTVTNTIAAANGCAATSASTQLTLNTQPTATLSAGGPTTFCQGSTVALTVSGGSAAATYQFFNNGQPINGATSASYTATTSGSYTAVVTNPGGCTATSNAVAVTVNPQTTATFSYSATLYCQNSGSTPTPTITGTAGGTFTATPAGLSLSSSTGAINLAASTAGTYAVTYSVGGPCPSSSTRNVTVEAAPLAALTANGPTTFCQGSSVVLTATGGAAGATYQFLNAGQPISGATSSTYTASASGSYSVRITSAGGCVATSTATTVTVNPQTTATFSYAAAVFCQNSGATPVPTITGTMGGSFTATPAGLSLNASTGAITLASSTAGTYAVTYSVGGPCPSSTTRNVTVEAAPAAALTASGPLTFCQGGSVVLTATGGGSGATYQFLNGGQPIGGATSSSYTATASGAYSVQITSANGCVATSTASTVTVNPQTTATFSYSAPRFCQNSGSTPTPTIAGTMGGTFAATPAGLFINPTTGAINLAASTAGAYTVTYSVGGPCPSSTSVSLTIEAAPAAALTTSGPTTFCQGGSVVLTATGGGAGATYQFLNAGQPISGATSSTYTATTSGSYSVVVTSAGGCVGTSTATSVTVNPQTTATFSYSASAFCQNSGTAPMPTITGTMGGAFSSAPAGLSLSASTGAINLAASTAGTYTVTYSVSGPCPSSSSVTVSVTAPAVATFSYAAPIYCPSGTNPAPVLGSGATAGTFTSSPMGLSLNASTGVITLSQSQPGTYTVTNSLAAAGGCPAATASTQLSISTVPVATLASSGPTTFCQGGSVVLTANGGGTSSTYQFLLNGQPISGATSASYTASASGAYSVVITNPGNCAATSPATTVTVNPIATPTVSYSAASFCQNVATNPMPMVSVAGGTFSSTTGLSLNSSTGAIDLAASAPGTYNVTYTAGSPCPGSGTATVTITAAPSAAFAYAGSTFCLTGSNPTPSISGAMGGTFSAPSGLSISASTGTINLAASTAGTYAVTYTVGGPCPASSTLTVTLTTAPVATFAYASPSGYCAGATTSVLPTFSGGGSAGTFSSTVGLSLNASTGAIDLAASQPGTYTVTNTIAASGACAAVSATATVTINAAPVASLTAGGPTTFCQGSSVALTAPAGSGLSYQFLLNGQPISGATSASYTATAAGSYAVTVTNASGCASTSAATTVMVNPATTATFTYPAASFCTSSTLSTTPTITGTAGGSFSAPAGLTLDAATGAITPGTSMPGTYTVTYSVGGPCPSTGTAMVTITAPAQAGFAYAATSACATGTTSILLAPGSSAGTFTASPAGLSLDAATGTVDLSASLPGTYTITNTVAAAGGCAATSATATLTVEAVPAQPGLSYQNGTLTATGPAGATFQFFLNGTAIGGATGTTYAPTQDGSYTVVATSAAGCSSAPSAAVMVVLTSSASAQAAFTLSVYPNPTTDGRLTVTLGSHRLPAQLRVFNALGQEVLKATVPASASSQPLDLRHLATGVYILRATTEAGTVSRRLIRE